MNDGRRHRRSIRLRGYDYAAKGAYFVTLVTFAREPIFGDISQGKMTLSALGEIATTEWIRSASIRQEIDLDDFVVMPNHLHAIVHIRDVVVGAHGHAPLRPVFASNMPIRTPRSLGSLVGGYKGAVTKRINLLRGAPGLEVWQRNYYERVIRDEAELNRIRQYILNNPAMWAADPENPPVVTTLRAR
jgi:REP element-mobilizing transposase RayT